MPDRRMLRHRIMTGGGHFTQAVEGQILHAECGRLGVGPDVQITFEFWFEGSLAGPEPLLRVFQLYQTGAEIPRDAAYCKSAKDDNGRAWHMYELFDWGE